MNGLESIHWNQWKGNGFLVWQPLVKRWNGNDPSLWSSKDSRNGNHDTGNSNLDDYDERITTKQTKTRRNAIAYPQEERRFTSLVTKPSK